MNWIKSLKLKKEANLLDSKWFILKTFLAISTAFLIFSNVPFVSRDMITVLFGLVLTLEPVNTVGLKNGWDQIFASFIGAASTSVLILLFGVNPITVGASVALTLYICLLLNWKSVSVVALFTAIYMTQFLQQGPDGSPDVGITFMLRFAALGAGVMVAVIYNYIFSLFQYKEISNKRSVYLIKQTLSNLASAREALKEGEPAKFQVLRQGLIEMSNNIEWISSHFSGIEKETSKSFFYSPIQIETLERSQIRINEIRNIGHLMFDIAYVIGEEKIDSVQLIEQTAEITRYFDLILDNLGSYKKHLEDPSHIKEPSFIEIKTPLADQNEYLSRIMRDLCDINKCIGHMAKEACA